MKRNVLSRYERDEERNIVIDVSATRIEDLYNDFDRDAPFIRRDLDQDFANYLIACAREVGLIPFIIRLTLAHLPDALKSSRIRGSLNTYFLYLAEAEAEMISLMFRRSMIFFGIGLAILFTSVWLNELVGLERTVIANVFAEGLTIAAWVSLWEALAIFLIEWFPHRKNVSLYRRLANTAIVFRSTAGVDQNADGVTPSQV